MKKINKEEAYRIFYMVKGHVNINDDTALSCYESYAKRLWYNNEASDKGFEEAYKNKNKTKKN
tara:strand:+ start:1611 stop:1799 length:189 start_codon:yes stop_codon:yes gene_type:complete